MSEQWIWRCDHVIPSDTMAARRVLDEVLQALESQHWQQRDVFSVHLAMEEALVNAIHHGNHLDTAKHVRVICLVSPDRVRIEIIDEGGGFAPAAVPDPTCPERLHTCCGRGVMLMKAFMSRVEFSSVGNHVVLEKDRSEAGQSL
jgi:serine/threonine-protein kinase RsbW